MTYREKELQEKIHEMYPEINRKGIGLGLAFDSVKDAYIVRFTRGNETLTTRLEKKDADECLNGTKCVSFGIQVAQFIGNFEDRIVFSRKAA